MTPREALVVAGVRRRGRWDCGGWNVNVAPLWPITKEARRLAVRPGQMNGASLRHAAADG
jgi:hypothetical protein